MGKSNKDLCFNKNRRFKSVFIFSKSYLISAFFLLLFALNVQSADLENTINLVQPNVVLNLGLEKDNQKLSTNIRPLHYKINIRPDLEKFEFYGKVSVLLSVLKKTNFIELNSKNLNFTSVTLLNGTKSNVIPLNLIKTDPDKETITINLPFHIENNMNSITLEIEYTGEINDKLVGIYRSEYNDKAGNKKFMAVTQFGPTDARRAFPCWDEPALKTTFDLKLEINKNLQALSNMDVDSKIEKNNLTIVKFTQTPVMPPYLLAFAIGEFEYIEAYAYGGKENPKVRCRIYTTPSLIEHGQFALDVATKSIKYFSETFGTPYPLTKLDLLGVADFGGGAMENWGLVTFRLDNLLVHKEFTDTKVKQNVAVMIGHEVSHQWFGNLVTMAWWDDIWLNEGFATWAGYLVTNHLFPEWDIWTKFFVDIQFLALQDDSLRSSHPIQVSVRRAQDVVQVFDSISYNKGASIIKMLAVYLGSIRLNSGIKSYLSKFKYKNASTADLWSELSKDSGNDISSFMSSWTKNMGYPVLTVKESEDGESIKITQNRYFSNGNATENEDQTIWNIPLRISTSANPKLVSQDIMTNRTIDIPMPNNILSSKDGWYKINTESTSFVRVNYCPNAIRRLSNAVKRVELFDSDRLGLLYDNGALPYSGHGKTSSFLTLLKAYSDEKNIAICEEVGTMIDTITRAWSDEQHESIAQLNNFIKDMYGPILSKVGWDSKPKEKDYDSRIRALAIRKLGFANDKNAVSTAKEMFYRYFDKKDNAAIHPDSLMTVLAIVIQFGSEKEYNTLKEYYLKEELPKDQRIKFVRGLGFTQSENLIQKHLDFVLSDQVPKQDIIHGIVGMVNKKKTRDLLWQWFKKSYSKLEEMYKGTPTIMIEIIKVCAGEFSSNEKAQDIKNFFSNKDVSEIDRTINKIIEEIKGRYVWVTRDSDDVKAWLDENKY
ncbi:hypothetical protein BB561_006720 [Smittium simulii]|uniref:Aminopeptidase n=1 Tax=Smittium simulii TaxID=133385 RepID=A0A2T9Y239_9FUNG|nr:hypothetical protein BB561_006720 [Smittium simulii]